jgi:hypothetical protein
MQGTSMLNHYRSPYPNYIHQLFITPSKHLYVLKDRRLKWQSKAMEVKLEGIEQADKEHVVHYIIADHTSAAFYAEVRTSRSLIEPSEFLIRAWRKKNDFFFHGIPEHVIVPNAISSKYPDLNAWLEQMQIGIVPPSSGFYAGIHQVRNWEKSFSAVMSFHEYLEKEPLTLDNMDACIAQTLQLANSREVNRGSNRLNRKQLWEMAVENRPPTRLMI